jgi:tripartite-type tricarboxylate transporter receptor subunit TctC
MKQPTYRTAGTTLVCAMIGSAGWAAADALAQASFPARPIRILVGSAPGGGLDTSARAISEPLSVAFNQPVVVDNRPGAAGSLSGQMLSKAPPDGHTICLGAIGNFAVNYFVYNDIGYHPLNDLAPVSGIADATNVLVVHTGVAATSVKELLQLAARERGLTYGSSGTGNAGHLAGELFSAMTKSDFVHVPYKGGGPAMIDLLGGRITMIFASPSTATQQVKAGKVRALAVTTGRRSALVPDLPTISEAGVPGFDVNNWYGMAAPAGTPPAVIARLNRDIVAALKNPEVAQLFLKQGLEPAPTTPEAFGKFIRSEFEKWGRVLKGANVVGR